MHYYWPLLLVRSTGGKIKIVRLALISLLADYLMTYISLSLQQKDEDLEILGLRSVNFLQLELYVYLSFLGSKFYSINFRNDMNIQYSGSQGGKSKLIRLCAAVS